MSRSLTESIPYTVPAHIYTCVAESGVVVLDARRGKYSIVPAAGARALTSVVRGWPVLPSPCEGEQMPDEPRPSLLNTLLRSGIIVRGDAIQRFEGHAIADTAKEALLDSFSSHHKPKVSARGIAAFLCSAGYAHGLLRYRRFDTLLGHLRSRKANRTSWQEASITKVRDLVTVFVWLRPFCYGETNACLFDSVALTDFLYRQRIFPELVIGVRTRPFAAHSWVQHRGFVLNSIPDYLTSYTPILSI